VSRGRVLSLVLWLVTAALAVRFALFAVSVARRPSDGFAAYYTAARLLRTDVPVSRFYDDAWFGARVAADAPGVRDIYFVNPPPAALILLPLADLSYGDARAIWTALNVLLLAAALGWMLRELGMRGALVPLFLIAALASQPLIAEFHQGQAYVLLLFLLVAAWSGYRRGRPALLGITLGTALVLKTAGVLLLPVLVVQRRWSAVAWTVGSAAAIALASLPRMGLSAWWAYAGTLRRLTTEPDLAVTAYQAAPGLVRHLTTPDATWNPAPLLDVAAAGRVAGLALSLGIVALVLVLAYRLPEQFDLCCAAALLAGIIVSPVSLDYHYPLLLLPLILLLARVTRAPVNPGPALALAAGWLLIAVDLPYRTTSMGVGLRALLAYPKLYGALMLLAVTVWYGWHEIREVEVSDEGWAGDARLQRQRG